MFEDATGLSQKRGVGAGNAFKHHTTGLCKSGLGCSRAIALAALMVNNSRDECAVLPIPDLCTLALRSDSIRNRLQPRPKVPNYGGPKVGIMGAVRSNFVLKARLPGTEFLDAETERQNRH